jgi:PPOX class probable F420-dependent enzyme
MTVEELAGAKYLSLTTYKKDGTPVATPLWAVRDDDAVALWTVTGTWKVKRIRRNPEVTLTPCDLRGRLLGEPVPGRAEIMSPEDTDRVRDLIRRKYGVIGRLTIWLSLRRRGRDGTVGIRVLI